MKTFNTVACIIILVLALVSAVCSYFLYEKRTQFVNGWEQMSAAIHKSAKTIDDQLSEEELHIKMDKKFASQLTADKLSHKKYSQSNLDQQLKNLTAQSEAVAAKYKELDAEYKKMVAQYTKVSNELAQVKKQRAAMAKVFSSMSQAVGGQIVAPATFESISTYSNAVSRVGEAVSRVCKNRSDIADYLAAIAKANGATFDKQLLFNNAKNGVAQITAVVNKHKTVRTNYANALRNISKSVGGSFVDNGDVPGKTVTAVQKTVENLNTAQKNLSNATVAVANLKSTIGKRDAEISRLNGVISDYKRALNLNPADSDPKIWRRGSDDVRKALVGSVTEVSKEYGYIVINFGSETTIKQTVGNKELILNADLESGLNFNVTRDGKFIAAVTLSNVGAKESTASIPVDKENDIQIGDVVIYSAKDVKGE